MSNKKRADKIEPDYDKSEELFIEEFETMTPEDVSSLGSFTDEEDVMSAVDEFLADYKEDRKKTDRLDLIQERSKKASLNRISAIDTDDDEKDEESDQYFEESDLYTVEEDGSPVKEEFEIDEAGIVDIANDADEELGGLDTKEEIEETKNERLDRIKQRHKALQEMREEDSEETAEIAEDIEESVSEPEVKQKTSDDILRERGITDEEDVVEEDVVEDVEEAVEEEVDDTPKKRGRPAGSTNNEGSRWENIVKKVDDLRAVSYDINFLKSYGIGDKKIDSIFDEEQFLKNKFKKEEGREPNEKEMAKMLDREEPEMWEMINEHVEDAPETDVIKIKTLMENAYSMAHAYISAQDRADAMYSEIYKGKKFSEKAMNKKSEKTKKDMDKLFKNQSGKLEALVDPKSKDIRLNKLEAEYMTQYFKNLIQEFDKKTNKAEIKFEALQDTSQDLKDAKELAKSISKK